MPDATLGRVGWLTHGSPLRRLYGRAFPAYFTDTLFTTLRESLRSEPGGPVRWRNCWRKTDYLGRWIFDEGDRNGVDVPVLDPPDHPRPCPPGDHAALHAPVGDICAPPPLRHSNYYVTAEYDTAVVDLDDLLGVPPAPRVDLSATYLPMVGGPTPSREDLQQVPPL